MDLALGVADPAAVERYLTSGEQVNFIDDLVETNIELWDLDYALYYFRVGDIYKLVYFWKIICRQGHSRIIVLLHTS